MVLQANTSYHILVQQSLLVQEVYIWLNYISRQLSIYIKWGQNTKNDPSTVKTLKTASHYSYPQLYAEKKTQENFSFATVQPEQNSDQGAYKVSASLSSSAGNGKNLATSSSFWWFRKKIIGGRKAGHHKIRQAPRQVWQLNLSTCILKEVVSLVYSEGNQTSKQWLIS